MRFREGARLYRIDAVTEADATGPLPSVFRQRGDRRMSYGSAMALQEAVYAALRADTVVMDLSGGAVFDAVPPGAVPGLHVSLGPERVRSRADKTGPARCTSFRCSCRMARVSAPPRRWPSPCPTRWTTRPVAVAGHAGQPAFPARQARRTVRHPRDRIVVPRTRRSGRGLNFRKRKS
jgi:hypothetical protein